MHKTLINLISLIIILFLSNNTNANSLNKNFKCLPVFYKDLTAFNKSEIIYKDCISKTEYSNLPNLGSLGWFSMLKSLKSLVTLKKSFTHTKDELPRGRKKLIHPYGASALIEYINTDNSPYTGIFKGATGLMRFSLAGSPKIIGVVPGLAIKFFIDGTPSVNIHVMNSVNGQGSNQNLFAKTFSNIIPKAKGVTLKLLQKWFSLFVTNPNRLRVNHLSLHQQDGSKEYKPLWPHKIEFRPTREVQIEKNSKNDFRVNLSNITPGLNLYNVYAFKDKFSKIAIKIGVVKLKTRFLSSAYGDERLFFKHNE